MSCIRDQSSCMMWQLRKKQLQASLSERKKTHNTCMYAWHTQLALTLYPTNFLRAVASVWYVFRCLFYTITWSNWQSAYFCCVFRSGLGRLQNRSLEHCFCLPLICNRAELSFFRIHCFHIWPLTLILTFTYQLYSNIHFQHVLWSQHRKVRSPYLLIHQLRNPTSYNQLDL